MPPATPSTCPHCREAPCLPLWRKLTLGPAATAHCRICGLRVGVDIPRATLALLPTFALILLVATGAVDGVPLLLALLAASLAVTFTLYAVWVRLIPQEISNPRTIAAGRARLAGRAEG